MQKYKYFKKLFGKNNHNNERIYLASKGIGFFKLLEFLHKK